MQRVNHYWLFSDIQDAWTLIDCSNCINLAQWQLMSGTIETLDKARKLGYLDPINHYDKWQEDVENDLIQINCKLKGCSVAKSLTYEQLFNGVGSYLMSEVLGRLYSNYNIKPWDNIGDIGFGNPQSVFVRTVATLKMLCNWIGEQYAAKFETILVNYASTNRSFYLKCYSVL